MKADVTRAYTDRITGKVHFAGEAVELTAERASELKSGGFVDYKEAAPKKAAPRKAAPKKAAKKADDGD